MMAAFHSAHEVRAWSHLKKGEMYTFLISYFLSFAATFLACTYIRPFASDSIIALDAHCAFARQQTCLVLAVVRQKRVVRTFGNCAPLLVNLHLQKNRFCCKVDRFAFRLCSIGCKRCSYHTSSILSPCRMTTSSCLFLPGGATVLLYSSSRASSVCTLSCSPADI